MPVIVRGEGAYVWDQHGKRYLDGLAGLFTSQIGHRQAELARAGAKQAETLAYFPLWTYAHPRAIELADRVASYAPGDLNRVFFTTGGSEAVESAWKLARQYFRMTGQPQRTKVISRYIAYHGTSMGALSITGIPELRIPFEPLVPGRRSRCRTRTSTGRTSIPTTRWPSAGGPPTRSNAPSSRRVRTRWRPSSSNPSRTRRMLSAAAGVLRAGARDLRPPRRAARLRRGHLRLRPTRVLVRFPALRLSARHHHGGEGPHLRLRPAGGDDRLRPHHGALPRSRRLLPARVHLRRPPGELCRRHGEPRRLRGRAHPSARAGNRARVPCRSRGPLRPADRGERAGRRVLLRD